MSLTTWPPYLNPTITLQTKFHSSENTTEFQLRFRFCMQKFLRVLWTFGLRSSFTTALRLWIFIFLIYCLIVIKLTCSFVLLPELNALTIAIVDETLLFLTIRFSWRCPLSFIFHGRPLASLFDTVPLSIFFLQTAWAVDFLTLVRTVICFQVDPISRSKTTSNLIS